jgi:hypothetical protein
MEFTSIRVQPRKLDKLDGHIYFRHDLFQVCSRCFVISMCMAYYKKIQAIRYEMPCLLLSPANDVCQKNVMDVKRRLMISFIYIYIYLDDLEHV